ncbi:MAG: DNA-directed RNA polymerase subunit beta, partial [Planctomycetaceae bacterium]|nr:DNA-directed RNA polymerase subunit beta [Planctomycetaceae bacterium]
MATRAVRRLQPTEIRHFGSNRSTHSMPDLTEIQTRFFESFLQYDVPPSKRKDQGIEGVLREIFPIESYDKSVRLEYVRYELGKPRYDPDECRQLRLTYGRPLRVWLRLTREQPIEEEVYLGDVPIMMGGGEFIINGAERVVVSQLHRSPGIDFVADTESTDRKTYNCRIIPERGSWIELNVSKKDTLQVRIDQSGKFSALTLLRAMDPKLSSDADILKLFNKTKVEKVAGSRSVSKLEGKTAADDIVYPKSSDRAGEILVEAGCTITRDQSELICTSGLKAVEVMPANKTPLIENSLREDADEAKKRTSVAPSHQDALIRIYQRLRPGNPAALEKASTLFDEKFRDTNRYRLGRVGRFRINRKLDLSVPETEMTLRADDLIAAISYMLDLMNSENESVEVDDIDHLGNRRLRTIDELASDELRKGFLKLRRTVQERMSLKDISEMTPRSLINPKSISAAIEYFFGRGELSQVVDQTNPLSMLTHERRLSALGPGGLNRKRAGFEVRDVHISHYGRICPIETPEGTNIGLISSLAIYSGVDSYGFLVTPYRKVSKSKLLDDVVWLRADEEHEAYLAPADAPVVDGRVQGETIVARYRGDFVLVPAEKVQYIDVAPSQMVGVSAGLIPFLEHDDANRALMGSNMQRQAVPLLVTEPPIVATGMERDVAANSGLLVRASRKGVITYVDAESIEINETDVYKLRKYVGLNERTCQNQKPIVQLGQKVEKNEVIADGAATFKGELALGRNVLVGFMSWDGFNFEDAIIISEELVEDDVYTSIHIEEYDIEIRDTKLGREEFTRDIPNVGERALHNLDDGGIVRIGTYVRSGDILVGKVSPKSKTELTPEEKLLHAIFGRAGEDVKNDSLEVPSGVEGIVIATEKFARQMSLSEEERRDFQKQIKEAESEGNLVVAEAFGALVAEIEKVLQKPLAGSDGSPLVRNQDHKIVAERAAEFSLDALDIRSPQRKTEIEKLYKTLWPAVEEALDAKERRLNSMKRGDELRPGVLQMVKVYVAAKRVISVGDKMAGRHGNKGVIAKVLPKEDMPFLADGTPVQIMLNPLGVPSRMNVGQILETHLGWAGKMLGFQAVTPVFDGASEEEINAVLDDANLPKHGKSKLYDGRTGEPLEQETTVGYIYML